MNETEQLHNHIILKTNEDFIFQIVMIVGIEYLHRLQLMLDVTRTKPGRLIETKELHNIRNGIVLATCVSLKATVKKYDFLSLYKFT